MKRIYFLVPDVSTTRTIFNELLLQRVDDKHIHVLAKRGTALGDLPEASYLQKTDFIPALRQGIVLGGMTGFISSLVVLAMATGFANSGGTILAASLIGSVFGGWFSSMVGSSVGNRQVKPYADAIEQGKVLMMVDVPKDRIADIEQFFSNRHPESQWGGTEPLIPAFP